jgi:hypothetical protein
MTHENRIFIDVEVPAPKQDDAAAIKKAVEAAIQEKLEAISTDLYAKINEHRNIIIFRSVRKKGGH